MKCRFFCCCWFLGCVLLLGACGKKPETEAEAPALNELGNSLALAAERQLGTAATLADETWVVTQKEAASSELEAAFLNAGMAALRESPTGSDAPAVWWIHTDASSANALRELLTNAGMEIAVNRRESPTGEVLALKVELRDKPVVTP